MDNRRNALKRMAAALAVVPAGYAVAQDGVSLEKISSGAAPVPPADSVQPHAAPAGATCESDQGPCIPNEAHGPVTGPAPWNLLSPLGAGASLALGWTLQDLSPISGGAAVMTLSKDDGAEVRVHMCRNTGDARGQAHTKRFDLIVMNGGDGRTKTEESLGRVVMGLADVIRANESGSAATRVVAQMQSHEERLELYNDHFGLLA